jgi:membrane associated rhomboid family serine protease
MIPLKDLNPTRTRPYVTVALIVINALVFLWQLSYRGEDGELLYYRYGTIPKCFLTQGSREKHDEALDEGLERLAVLEIEQQLRSGKVLYGHGDPRRAIEELAKERAQKLREKVGTRHEWLTLFTSMFMHGGLLHILGNMWFLWIFGNNIEDACGRIRFVVFYLVCGLISSLAHIVSGPGSVVPSIGASGAISGVLGAYIILYPHARVYSLVPLGWVFWPMDVPAWLFLGIWILFQWISGLASLRSSATGGVAWFAHIGGFLAGMGLIFLFRQRRAVPPEDFGLDLEA